MKLTFFIGGLSGGGAERVVCNLANYLIMRGHNVSVMTMVDNKQAYFLNEKVKRISLIKQNERKGFIFDSIVRFCRLRKQMIRSETDTFVVFLPTTTILMLFLRHMTKAKVIVSERVNPGSYSGVEKVILKKLAHRADAYVFQTKNIQQWYGNSVGSAKSVVIPNAINEEFLKEKYVGEREKRIVGAGRLTNQKNFTLLIKAFAGIAPQFPDYKLVIYGEGPEKQALVELVEDLHINNRVLFPGYVTNLGEEIKSASLFVLSSDFEGMPNALMEAMALGVPCISTDCDGGGARFLIDNGKNGFLIEKGNVDQLKTKMIEILSDTELANKLSNEAVKIQDLLSPEKVYRQWEQLIMDIGSKQMKK